MDYQRVGQLGAIAALTAAVDGFVVQGFGVFDGFRIARGAK